MERKQLLVPVEWKTVAGDPGMLDGYVSVFGNTDEIGDVVLPGAFKKTLADWARSKQRMPLLVDHKMSTDGVIGSIIEAHEDDVGLRIRARFSSIQKAQDIRTLLREKHINGMSFTYEPIRARPGTKAGKQVRYLEELRIFEGTVTPFPMNTEATPVLVKDATGAAVADVQVPAGVAFDPWTDAMAKALELGVPEARRAAVKALLAVGYVEPDTTPDPPASDAAGPADEPPTASAAATTDPDGPAEGTATTAAAERDELRHRIDDATAYALGVINLGPRDDAPDGTPPEARAGALAPLEVARAMSDLDQLEHELRA